MNIDPERLRLLRLFALELATPEQAEALAKSGDHMLALSLPMRRTVAYDVKAEGETLRFVISDEKVNRYGDIVRQDGWELRNFRRNPIALWGHSHEAPIGTWPELGVTMHEGGKVLSGAVRLAVDASDEIRRIDRLARAGVLRAVSPGFMNLETRKPSNEEDRKALGLGPYGLELTKNDLHEISIVSVGAQPGALRMSVEAGKLSVEDAEYAEKLRAPTERDEMRIQDRDAAAMTALRFARIECDMREILGRLEEMSARLAAKSQDERAGEAPAYMRELDRELSAALERISK